MSNGGIWQPPRTGRVPTTTAAGRRAVVRPAASRAPRPRAEPAPRRAVARGKVIAAAVGAVAIVGAGVFAVTRITGDAAPAARRRRRRPAWRCSPRSRTRTLLGMVDVLLPGERETLSEPAQRPRRGAAAAGGAQRGRQPVRRSAASTSSSRTSRSRSTETNVDDIVNLEIAASITGSLDGEALPIGDWIRDNLDQDLVRARHRGRPSRGATRCSLTAVREDGRWYLSLFYTAAESIRSEQPTSPTSRARASRRPAATPRRRRWTPSSTASSSSTSRRVIASLNPDEFQALQRYAPLFLDDGPGRARRGRRRHARHRPTASTTCPAAATRRSVVVDRPDDRRHRRG